MASSPVRSINRQTSGVPLSLTGAAVMLAIVALSVFLKTVLAAKDPTQISDGLGLFEPGIGLFNDWRDRVSWLSWLFSPIIFMVLMPIERKLSFPRFVRTLTQVVTYLVAVYLVFYAVFLADLPLLPHIKSANVVQGVLLSILILVLVRVDIRSKQSETR